MVAEDTSALKAVDFFCGEWGMSRGLSNADIIVLGGVDNNPALAKGIGWHLIKIHHGEV